MLQPQIKQRATLNTIAASDWVKKGDYPLCWNLNPELEKLNANVVTLMEQNGIDARNIADFEKKHHPGPIKAAYHLFKLRFEPRTLHTNTNFQMPLLQVDQTRKYGVFKKDMAKRNLLSVIRQGLAATAVTDGPLQPQGVPPVCIVIEHKESSKDLQLTLLRNLLAIKGKIAYFDEDDPQSFFGMLPVRKRPLLNSDGLDPELKAVVDEAERYELLFKAETREIGPVFQTRFLLLNGYETPWIIEDFDEIIADLIKHPVLYFFTFLRTHAKRNYHYSSWSMWKSK